MFFKVAVGLFFSFCCLSVRLLLFIFFIVGIFVLKVAVGTAAWWVPLIHRV